MDTDIASALKRRATLVGGKAWGADKGKPRVYLDYGRKDVSAYFGFPNANESGLGMPEFKCYIDDSEATEPRQGNWYTEMKAKVKGAFRMKGLAIMALERKAEELAAVLAEAKDVDDALHDQLAKLLADGKVEQAMAAITAGDEAPF